MNRKRGFTLMEMVVVVGVILILTLLALLTLNPKTSINKAYDAHRKKDLESLRIAFENYYTDYSCYPTQAQISNCNSNELDPYIKEIPCDPISNTPYELIANPPTCPQNFIAYTQLKYDQDQNADSFNCFSVNSPNSTTDPSHDCNTYFDSFTPTETPSPTPSGTGTPTPSPTPTSTPVPTPTGNYRHCSSVDTCSPLPTGKICYPYFDWDDTDCSGTCSDPVNVCTPYYL